MSCCTFPKSRRRHSRPEREGLCCHRCVHGDGTTEKQCKCYDKVAEAQGDVKPNSNEKPERRKDPGASRRRGRGGELAGRSRSRMMLETRRRSRRRRRRSRMTWNGTV